jgi:DEAD/DEAH box helicase domain-containing protein
MPQPRIITFDIETTDLLGTFDISTMEIALVGTHDSHTNEFDSFLVDDLPRLWKLLESADILVGYNSDHFDIPILNRYYPGDLTNIKSLDLLKEVYAVLGRRLKLDAIAEATIGEHKSAHGLQSLKWWREGKVELVREYCLKDVDITKKIFDFALKHKTLKYKELGKVKEVQLNTSRWLDVTQTAAMTQTLGF